MAINVLIVDDSRTVRAVIAKALRLSGIETREVLQAGNGQEALDVMKESWVDLILLDINMPVMNGVEFVKKLRAEDLSQDVPVIIVSTEGSQARIDELKALGVGAYLRKPFEPEQLLAAIHKELGVDA